MRRHLIIIIGAATCALATAADAADNYVVKDGSGANLTIRAKDVGAGVQLPMSVPTDPTGAPYSGSSGLPVAQQGAWTFGLSGPIPAGTNAIGAVTVTGTVPLPTGAATAAKQDEAKALLQLLVDAAGSLAPSPVDQAGASAVSSTALEAARLVKTGAGRLASFELVPQLDGWALVFDAAAAPADGAVTPLKAYPVRAGQHFAAAFPIPITFATGLVIVFSTSGPFTKTASATAFISGDVR